MDLNAWQAYQAYTNRFNAGMVLYSALFKYLSLLMGMLPVNLSYQIA
jgi:hypothetical protein